MVYSQSETGRQTVVSAGSNIQCHDLENCTLISGIPMYRSFSITVNLYCVDTIKYVAWFASPIFILSFFF